MRSVILAVIFSVASHGSLTAKEQTVNSIHLPQADMAENLKEGDSVHVINGMGCFMLRSDDFRCVKIIGVNRVRSAVVIAPAIKGVAKRYMEQNCSTPQRGFSHRECAFDIKFNLISRSSDPMGSTQYYASDSIELINGEEKPKFDY